MELKIVSAVENPLLKRKHIVGNLVFPGEKTPSNKDVVVAVAKATGGKEDAVAVRRIETAFGSTTAALDAYVYESKELLDKTEARPKKKEAPKPAEGS
jgi:ribosomal protein S24E